MSNPRAPSRAQRLTTAEDQSEPSKGLFDELHREIDAIFNGLSALSPTTSDPALNDQHAPEALLAAIAEMRRELDALELLIRKRVERTIPPPKPPLPSHQGKDAGFDPDRDWWQSLAPIRPDGQKKAEPRAFPSHIEPLKTRAREQLRDDLREIYEHSATPRDALELPTTAPELWSARAGRKENPIVFIRRVYGSWLGQGLTRAHIRRLDLPLYRALSVWLTRHRGASMPELPSRSEAIDRTIETLAEDISPEQLRRLGLALQSRRRSSK